MRPATRLLLDDIRQHVRDTVEAHTFASPVAAWGRKWIRRPLDNIWPWQVDTNMLECPFCEMDFLEHGRDTKYNH